MAAKFEKLAEELQAFDELTKTEMKDQYWRSLRFINEQIDTIEGGRRIGAARALVTAHGFAVRYYARFGDRIDADAFPGNGQNGDGPALRMDSAGHSLQLQNFEDDLFEFVVALRSDYREELLALLKDGWIRAVTEP